MMNPARFLISACIISLMGYGVSSLRVNYLKITDDEQTDVGKLNIEPEVPKQKVTEVAFSAGLSTHQNLSHSETVVFDRVFSNTGGGYNHRSGIFTCPKAGNYIFHFSALTLQSLEFWLELAHNGNYVVSAFGRLSGDYASGGNTAILDLAEGDTVYIRVHRGASLYGTPAEIYSTFSAFKITSSASFSYQILG